MDGAIFIVVAGVVGLLIGLIVAQSKSKPSDDGSDNAGMSLLQDQIANLTTKLDDRLDKTQTQMRDSMSKQSQEAQKIIKDVTERLTKLDETNKRVVDVTGELKQLQNILQNPKQRGVVGEYYLKTVLDNVMPPSAYQMQYKFSDGQIVDAVLFLEKNLILPVDSKFSLENYNRMREENDPTKKEEYVNAFKRDLKNRIDETSKYIRPDENTMDFAFMFVPSEAVYYDLLIGAVGTVSSRDLIEYAYQDKKVIIVSPTSFMAYLQTVLQGLNALKIEKEAKEIQKRVGQLGQHIAKHEDLMHRLGNALSTTVNHFNNAHHELKKIDTDVVRIASTNPSVEPLLIDKPKSDE